MKGLIGAVAVLCLLAASASFAVGDTLPIARQVTAVSASRTAMSIARNVEVSRLAGLTHDSLARLTAMGSANGQTFGAGGGQVGIIGDAGLVASSAFSVPIRRATGLSAFTPGKLILGDQSDNSVFVVDPGTRQSAKLFSLSELNARGIQAAEVLKLGTLGGLAFDGKYIYAGMASGYSSSIFKIDPGTKSVVAQAWAPGPDPSAMQFVNGSLFVLDRQSVRRFDSNFALSQARVDVDVQDGRGLIVSGDSISILSPGARTIQRMKVNTLQLMQPSSVIQTLSPAAAAVLAAAMAPQNYAVLICGDCAESGYDEFWNDTVWMYKMLRAKGYPKERIFVLYAYGADYATSNPNYQMPGETVTDFAATPANVDMVFNGLANGDAAHGIPQMKSNDTLFIWTFDHGGGGPDNSYLCLWGGSMTDTHFADKANAIPCEKRAIFMQQCRSGGFIDNLSNAKTYISTACRGGENAHEADAEKESYGGRWYHHGEYNYYIISALGGKTCTGTVCNADTTGDGKCCSTEAHNWNVIHENQSETPQSNNSAVGLGFFLN
jgi:hypothetical protein